MRQYLATFLLILAGLLGSGFSVDARAQDGIARQMQDTFGSMVSTTEPQVVTNSSRGVISGGNFTVKNKVVSADLFSLQLPYVRAGCGGWDIFGGSFSFISSEQIVAMLRSIAASAIGYAFKLALQSISDDIANILEQMWKSNEFANILGKSSCEIGAALVDSFMSSGSSTKSNQAASNKTTSEGSKDDHNESKNNTKDDSAAAEEAKKDAAKPTLQQRTAIVEGNHIINAFKLQGDWVTFGGDRFGEEIQSVTGTVIVCVPSTNGCPKEDTANLAGQADVLEFGRGPMMTLNQMVKGRLKYSSVKRWRCNNSDCLNPTEATDSSYVGTEELLRKAILGPNNAPGEGIIGKWATNTGSWTDAEKGIISAGGSFMAMAMNLAVANEQDGRDYVEAFIETIAADITYRVIDESLTKVQSAVSSVKGGGMVKAQKMVDEARFRINEELKAFHAQNTTSTAKWDYFNSVRHARGPSRMPGLQVKTGQ